MANIEEYFYALQVLLQQLGDPEILTSSIISDLLNLDAIADKVGDSVQAVQLQGTGMIEDMQRSYTHFLEYLRLAFVDGCTLLKLLVSRCSLLLVFDFELSTLKNETATAQERVSEAQDLVSAFRQETENARRRRDAKCGLLCKLKRGWRVVFRKSSVLHPIRLLLERLGFEIPDELDDWREIFISTPINPEQNELLRKSLRFITQYLETLANAESLLDRIEFLLPEFRRSSSSKAVVVMTRLGNRVDKLLDLLEANLRVLSDFVQKWAASDG